MFLVYSYTHKCNDSLFLATRVMSELTDQQLVFRISVFHDQDAFAQLHSRYYPKIYKFIAYKIARSEDAEDISSQIFLKTWEYLTSSRENKIRNFRAFIYKAARNNVAGFYRMQGNTPKILDIDDTEYEIDLPDVREDIFKKQLTIQDTEQLIECTQKLHDSYREIIALRFFEELTIEEIAEVIGKKPGNVRVLIHRGLQALRNLMNTTI